MKPESSGHEKTFCKTAVNFMLKNYAYATHNGTNHDIQYIQWKRHMLGKHPPPKIMFFGPRGTLTVPSVSNCLVSALALT